MQSYRPTLLAQHSPLLLGLPHIQRLRTVPPVLLAQQVPSAQQVQFGSTRATFRLNQQGVTELSMIRIAPPLFW